MGVPTSVPTGWESPASRFLRMTRIGFLGPPGTFTEQALLSWRDISEADLTACSTISDVLIATERGDVDLGFVPIENSIEGTVNVTLDTLAFETSLLIQHEVVLGIQLNLLAPRGTTMEEVTRVISFPHATAQVREFLTRELPHAETVAANSTAEAARLVGEAGDRGTAAVGTSLAGELYDLEVIASNIADHPENETRFVAVATKGVPQATGHDKTTIVCFQQADRPGSLLAILQEFAARAINLSKLESRPTKRGLGDYCFIIDLEGHIADEVVGDCLRELKAKVADVKFLGSYPAAGEHGEAVRREADEAWKSADFWLAGLRKDIDGVR